MEASARTTAPESPASSAEEEIFSSPGLDLRTIVSPQFGHDATNERLEILGNHNESSPQGRKLPPSRYPRQESSDSEFYQPLIPQTTVVQASAVLRKECVLSDGSDSEYSSLVQQLLAEGGRLARPYINYDTDGGKQLTGWADLSSIIYRMPQFLRRVVVSSWTAIHAFLFWVLYMLLRGLLEGGWFFNSKSPWSEWRNFFWESLKSLRLGTYLVNVLILCCPFLCLMLGPGWDARARRTIRMGALVLLAAFLLTLLVQLLMQARWLIDQAAWLISKSGAVVGTMLWNWGTRVQEFAAAAGGSEIVQRSKQTVIETLKKIPIADYTSNAWNFAAAAGTPTLYLAQSLTHALPCNDTSGYLFDGSQPCIPLDSDGALEEDYSGSSDTLLMGVPSFPTPHRSPRKFSLANDSAGPKPAVLSPQAKLDAVERYLRGSGFSDDVAGFLRLGSRLEAKETRLRGLAAIDRFDEKTSLRTVPGKQSVAAVNEKLPEFVYDWIGSGKEGVEKISAHRRRLMEDSKRRVGDVLNSIATEGPQFLDSAKKKGGELLNELLWNKGKRTFETDGTNAGEAATQLDPRSNPSAVPPEDAIPPRQRAGWYLYVWPFLLKVMRGLVWVQKRIALIELAALIVYGIVLVPWVAVGVVGYIWAVLFDRESHSHVNAYKHLDSYHLARWAKVKRVWPVDRVTQNSRISKAKELGVVRLKIIPWSQRWLHSLYSYLNRNFHCLQSRTQGRLRELEIRVFLKFLDSKGQPVADPSVATNVNFRLTRETGVLAGQARLLRPRSARPEPAGRPGRLEGISIHRLSTRIDTHLLSLKKLDDVMQVASDGEARVVEVVVAEFDHGSRVAGEKTTAHRPIALQECLGPDGLLVVVPGLVWWDYQAVVFGQSLVEHGCQMKVVVATSYKAIRSVLLLHASRPKIPFAILCIWDGWRLLDDALKGERVPNIVLLQPWMAGRERTLQKLLNASAEPLAIITGDRTITEEDLHPDLAEMPAVWVESDERPEFIISVAPLVFSLPWRDVVKVVERQPVVTRS